MKDIIPLGHKITDNMADRDAVHIAIYPAYLVAGSDCHPGTHVGFIDERYIQVSSRAKVKIGIIDPFINSYLEPGDRVYVLLYPNTITGLRHHWEHPLLDHPKPLAEREEAREWLEHFCYRYNFAPDLEAMLANISIDNTLIAHDKDVHAAYDLEDNDLADFRQYYKIYTGREPNPDLIWTCTC